MLLPSLTIMSKWDNDSKYMMTPHNNSLSTVEMFSLHEGAPDLMTLHIIPL